MRTYRRFRVIIAAVAAALLLAVPALAASGGYIYFIDSEGFAFGTACIDSALFYNLGYTGAVDDSGGNDYVAVVTVDALGRPLDVDYDNVPVGVEYAGVWYLTDLGMINSDIAARPITIALFDIPYPYGAGGGPSENSVKAADWVLANGTFMAEAVQDPIISNPDGCADVPLQAPFSFRYIPAETFIGWPADGRLNPHRGAPIAIYAVDDGVFEIWGIDVNTGMGMLAFTADTTGVEPGDAPFIGAEGTNPYTFQPITMYVLPSGEFQINTYYGFGKPYIVTWPMDSTEPGDLYVQDW